MKQGTGMKILLGFILAVAIFGLFNLGTRAFYPAPDHNDYCSYYSYPIDVNGKGVCEKTDYNLYTIENGNCVKKMINGCGANGVDTFMTQKQCETGILAKQKGKTCSQIYDDDYQKYYNSLFYVMIAVGLISAVVGLFVEPLMFQIAGIVGGSFLLVQAIFTTNNEKMAFIAGFLVVVLLSYFAYKKYR